MKPKNPTLKSSPDRAMAEDAGTGRPSVWRGIGTGEAAMLLVVALQGFCAAFFVSSIFLSVFGIAVRPLPWAVREYLEIGAALGLTAGVVIGTLVLWRTLKDRRAAEEGLWRARGDFMALLTERFECWQLTPAEAEVAIFTIKGCQIREIAKLRHTSEGTVKAQANAIYRKAGVNGRAQLLSLFIEDLMCDVRRPAPVPLPRRFPRAQRIQPRPASVPDCGAYSPLTQPSYRSASSRAKKAG